jgi:hypothetical protein
MGTVASQLKLCVVPLLGDILKRDLDEKEEDIGE